MNTPLWWRRYRYRRALRGVFSRRNRWALRSPAVHNAAQALVAALMREIEAAELSPAARLDLTVSRLREYRIKYPPIAPQIDAHLRAVGIEP